MKIPIWIKPKNILCSYKYGKMVQWPKGVIWMSVIENNMYEPGTNIYGWELF
jgi:hypothetical protein